MTEVQEDRKSSDEDDITSILDNYLNHGSESSVFKNSKLSSSKQQSAGKATVGKTNTDRSESDSSTSSGERETLRRASYQRRSIIRRTSQNYNDGNHNHFRIDDRASHASVIGNISAPIQTQAIDTGLDQRRLPISTNQSTGGINFLIITYPNGNTRSVIGVIENNTLFCYCSTSDSPLSSPALLHSYNLAAIDMCMPPSRSPKAFALRYKSDSAIVEFLCGSSAAKVYWMKAIERNKRNNRSPSPSQTVRFTTGNSSSIALYTEAPAAASVSTNSSNSVVNIAPTIYTPNEAQPSSGPGRQSFYSPARLDSTYTNPMSWTASPSIPTATTPIPPAILSPMQPKEAFRGGPLDRSVVSPTIFPQRIPLTSNHDHVWSEESQQPQIQTSTAHANVSPAGGVPEAMAKAPSSSMSAAALKVIHRRLIGGALGKLDYAC